VTSDELNSDVYTSPAVDASVRGTPSVFLRAV